MDSSNSGSSSGADDDYASRAAVAFNTPPPPPLLSFDPFAANYLQNFNVPWPGTSTPRSEPYPTTHLTSLVPQPEAAAARGAEINNLNESRLQQQGTKNQASARGTKKRSRASRRAPTTVLTTDTSNFRAMVQEFTGIPAPPFDTNILNKSSRLDLFGTRSTSFDGGAYPPPYLLRPFAQKLPPPPPFMGSDSTVNNHNSLLLSTSSSNIFNIIQNPINVMNSLYQNNNPSFPTLSNSSNNFLFNSKPDQHPSNEVQYNYVDKMGGGLSDQFGLSHGNDHNALSGLPSLISPDHKDDENEAAAPDNNNYKFSRNALQVNNRNSKG